MLSSEERSLESFVQTTAEADQPLLAFLGQDGHIPLVSLKSMTTVGSVKMNGSSRAGVFSRQMKAWRIVGTGCNRWRDGKEYV